MRGLNTLLLSNTLRGLVVYQHATIKEIAQTESLPPALSRLGRYTEIQVEVALGDDHDIFMNGVNCEIQARRDPKVQSIQQVRIMCRRIQIPH